MNEEPFLRRVGIDVPEDVRRDGRRLVVGGPEGVVEAVEYQEYKNLEMLELQEGTLTIGREAFHGCGHLNRVDSPSSLRWIGHAAFYGCSSLSKMNLSEGLRSIGRGAFLEHSFEQVTIPSSVLEIGNGAFALGKNLTKVTLTGGTVILGRDAFYKCRQLRSIATPSVVIVVEEGGFGGTGRADVVTGGTVTNREVEPTRLILSSPYLASMQSADDAMKVTDVTRVKDAIHRIAGGWPRGKVPCLLAYENAADENRVRQGAERMRSRFFSILSAHRRAIASILERAPIWESAGGGVEPGVVEIILSFLGDVEG